MDSITITSGKKEIKETILLPLSKSISNRILMMSAISGGVVQYEALSDADDTLLLKKLLEQIKAGDDHNIDVVNAGTVMRFLTAYLSIRPGNWTLTGDKRMRQRPIGGLVDALKDLGAEIAFSAEEGYPPLKISGKALSKEIVSIYPGTSSQFISALMMIGPILPGGLKIRLTGPASSIPYIEMTASLMKQAGADIKLSVPEIAIAGTGYMPIKMSCERDWSAAAPWYQLFSLSQSEKLFIPGLKDNSIQGDRMLADYFSLLGVETSYQEGGVLLSKNNRQDAEISLNLRDQPDLAPALIVATAAKGLKGHFHGLESLRIKESDRIKALIKELGKGGIICQYSGGVFSFDAQKIRITQPVDTYKDHRIAMAFAPLAILGDPVTINEPGVVSKSYPGFFEQSREVLGVTF